MKALFRVITFFSFILFGLIGVLFVIKPEIPLKAYVIVKHEFGQMINKKFVLNRTFVSNNKQYALEVYKQKNYSALVGVSSYGFAEAYVVLKDEQGKVLLEPHWYASCDFLIGDLQIEWQKGKVYFTKFNFIDLKDYTYDCY